MLYSISVFVWRYAHYVYRSTTVDAYLPQLSLVAEADGAFAVPVLRGQAPRQVLPTAIRRDLDAQFLRRVVLALPPRCTITMGGGGAEQRFEEARGTLIAPRAGGGGGRSI